MRTFRRPAILALMAASLALPLGPVASGAAATPAPGTVPPAVADRLSPASTVAPWEDVHVELGEETRAWLTRENITLSAVPPFVMDADGRGFTMRTTATAGDPLDGKDRIFYPGGLRLRHADSGRTLTLDPTYIRVTSMPRWSSGLSVDGEKTVREFPVADTFRHEVMSTARPTSSGLMLMKVPFYLTPEASTLLAEHSGAAAPEAGSLFGTLTPAS